MANRVEIEIVAKDMASQILNGIRDALKDIGLSAQELAVAGGLVTTGAAMVTFAANATKATIEWNQAVEEMIAITGNTPEIAARMVNLFDAFGISAAQATMSARALAKEGIALDIESIIELSEQYQALQTPAEKVDFLIKNLGRSGFEYNEILSQTPGRLREIYGALNDNLIPTEQNLEATTRYGSEVNELNKNWLAVKVAIGSEIVPELNALLGFVNANWDAVSQWTGVLIGIINPLYAVAAGIRAIREAQEGGAINFTAHPQGNALDLALGAVGLGGGGASTDINLNTGGFGPGFRAAGGPVMAGGSYIVGERGPELFTPGQSGMVTPGGVGKTLVFNFPGFIGSQNDLESAMRQAVRRMQVDGEI